ncbi:FprA family A-type flavoprotein [Desulfovibrio sp. OttesenSCG-928-A18]|nr:FprA family A-type flavoprotein [Desulfovibrio sp. OttesenSCG-928-A18]
MQPVEIKKDIFWVGAVDFESRDFHGYSLSPQGTTYNCYVVKDEKNVLFDTVKHEFTPTMLCRLSKLMDPADIDYIVVNHVELDHSGSLPQLIAMCRPEAVICSPMGQKAIEAHFKDWEQWPIKVVKSGDSISIGKRSVCFLETRMLHWPDSMFSYIPEDRLLISNDAFGQNIASTERFSDELDRAVVEHAMTEYYHNIVLPYSPQVLKVLDMIEAAGMDIDMIAPDHGLIFRGKKEAEYALAAYRRYAEQKTQKRAVIIYDTMWHSTEKMAYAIAEGLRSVGVESRIMDLKHNHHSRVMTELARCGLVIVGSPTHNNGILPHVAAMLAYMKGLRPKNRIGGAFGSFGWSGECVNAISQSLSDMGMELPVEAVKNKYVPGHEALAQCAEMGKMLGQALIDKCAADSARA